MNVNKSAIGVGLLTAIASSLCCITPLLAILAGTTGFAATFQWVEPLRPYLVGLTVMALSFAWYQQLKPVAKDGCGCAVTKPSFFQGKTFLGIITIFAVLMLAFPLYSKTFFPSQDKQVISVINETHVQAVEFEVIGMTCGGCEAHVEHAVGNLAGIVKVKASFEDEKAVIKFDSLQTNILSIKEAIKTTSYKVGESKIIKTPNSGKNK